MAIHKWGGYTALGLNDQDMLEWVADKFFADDDTMEKAIRHAKNKLQYPEGILEVAEAKLRERIPYPFEVREIRVWIDYISASTADVRYEVTVEGPLDTTLLVEEFGHL